MFVFALAIALTIFAVKTDEIEGIIDFSDISNTMSFTQGEEIEELGGYSLISGNSIMAVSSPENVNLMTLGAAADEQEDTEKRRSIIEYSVKDGDTYSQIAEFHNISLNTLLWANALTTRSKPKIGDKLVILPINGILYFVKKGDSVGKIAKTYKSNSEDIAIFNELDDEQTLYSGDAIIVPDGKMPTRQTAVAIATKFAPSKERLPEGYFICPIPKSNGVCFITQGLHYSNAIDFGIQGGISCNKPVYAAAGGEVMKIKYGYNGGYGNYVKLLHPSGITTLYSHMNKINVVVGQQVSMGEVMGLIGNTGRTIGITGCHVHFEVGSINGNPPLNPFAK